MDSEKKLVLGGILALAILLAIIIANPNTGTSSNVSTGQQVVKQSCSPPLAERAPTIDALCQQYRILAAQVRPEDKPDYNCIIDCGMPPRGACPEEAYILTRFSEQWGKITDPEARNELIKVRESIRQALVECASTGQITTSPGKLNKIIVDWSQIKADICSFRESENTALLDAAIDEIKIR